jgi:hypothetical protein
MFIGMKALDSRGEYLVDFMIDGYGSQYVGPGGDGEHLFRAWDNPDGLLKVWQDRFAGLDAGWTSHAAVRLCS